MPPRKQANQPAPAAGGISPAAAKPTSSVTSASSQPTKPQNTSSSSGSIRNAQDVQEIVLGVWNNYVDKTPQRVKLLDIFLAFLVAVGVLQFVYCVIAGNYPFNAFLSGFSATVGQFVLTVSLRMQTNPENQAEFETISHERAFHQFIGSSFILHAFCINFIN